MKTADEYAREIMSRGAFTHKTIASAMEEYAKQLASESFIAGRDCVFYDEHGYWMQYDFIEWFNKKQGIPPASKQPTDPNKLPF